MLIEAVRRRDRVMLRYQRAPALRPELERLTQAENRCCDVEGVRFELEDTGELYVMHVIAPEASCASIAVQTVLENFAGMPERS